MKTRTFWGSRIGFIFAAASSAVGLANIWRFPYIVGKYGGAAFIFVYLICLLLIGFPVFIAEIVIGRSTHKNPVGAFHLLGRTRLWKNCGKLTVVTGFLISSFYSVVAGWVLGYLVLSLKGDIVYIHSLQQAQTLFTDLIANPLWTISFHALFICFCGLLLVSGIRKGIENFSKYCMPLLLVLLVLLIIKGAVHSSTFQALDFLFRPNWSSLTPTAILIALGHSFFTLSLGQGTMITYGSYLSRDENIPFSCLVIALMDTLVALLAACAVFLLVFAARMQPESGPGLVFSVLPTVFSELPGASWIASVFFLLLILAALTSEISAMEPVIAYLQEEHGMKRKSGVILAVIGAFILGIPAALSFTALSVGGKNFFDLISFIALDVFVPIGGFSAVILVAWKWGLSNTFQHLTEGTQNLLIKVPIIRRYFIITLKLTAPILIIVVFLHATGLFKEISLFFLQKSG